MRNSKVIVGPLVHALQLIVALSVASSVPAQAQLRDIASPVTPRVLTQAFTPPAGLTGALQGVNFGGQLVGEKFRSRFAECDTKDTCDGKPLKYGCSNDRNRNSTLL